MFKKVVFVILVSVIANSAVAVGQSVTTKSNFFLLSKVTTEDSLISEEDYKKAYDKMIGTGSIFYRNGDKYRLIVPMKNIYLSSTINFSNQGREIAGALADFIGIYNIESMKFTGIYFSEAKERDELSEKVISGFKGDYGKHMASDVVTLSKDRRYLPADLVSLKQASHLADAIQKSNDKVSRVNISVTQSVKKNMVFINELNSIRRESGNQNAIQAVSGVFEEMIDQNVFSDGAIIIEFKKY